MTAIVLAVVALASCTVPLLDFSGKKCLSDPDCPASEACLPDGGCAVSEADARAMVPEGSPMMDARVVDPCTSIPRFSGTQRVDGANDDFAGVPVRSYRWSDLAALPAVVGDRLDLAAQVAWSDAGLHLFLHVHYESGVVVLPNGADPLWFGDAIEVFLKGDARLTGRFDGVRDQGAIQIVAVPDATGMPRSQTYVNQGMTVLGPLPAGSVAARRDPDGYDLEFLVGWSLVGAPSTPPAAGSSVGFDLGVDYHTRAPDGGASNVQYQLLLSLAAVPDLTANCPGEAPIPSCDDRTWCTPRLAP